MVFRSIFIFALFAAIACCSASATQVCAESVPVWRPYREQPPVVARAVPLTRQVAALHRAPAQCLESSTVGAITDAQLDQLCVDCCEDPFEVRGTQIPIVVDPRFDDPVLAPLADAEAWQWQLLPDDVIWRSYWAGSKEPRISAAFFEEYSNDVSLLDVSFGGRVSILRYEKGSGVFFRGATEGASQKRLPTPFYHGWEVQIEGGSMLRLNLDENWDLEAVDFRFGVPIIYGRDKVQWKFSYYHLSSHLGDEFIIRTGAGRINFSRDTLVLGFSYFPRPSWRWYAETGWAFYADEGTEPWEFQFGLDYARPGPTGKRGTPFAALNGHLRQEVDFGGNLVAQAGWLWRGQGSPTLRMGLHYFNGKSNQFEFFDQFEQQLGAGMWYDY